MIGYTAGDCISGTIDIHLTEQKFFSDLTLEFFGVERILV